VQVLKDSKDFNDVSYVPFTTIQRYQLQSKLLARDCNGFYIGKTKWWLHEHLKALAKNYNTSAIADHVKTTGHNIKWDHCKIKETLFIQELEPAFNVNIGSEKLMIY